MPTLFFIHCSDCEFELKSEDSRTYLRMENGGRELLPHPREYDRARELTGEELPALQGSGRLELVDVYFCRACGALQEFPRARIEDDPDAYSKLEEVLESTPCPRCKSDLGWLDLFSVDGEPCPRCGEGTLEADWDIEE